MRNQASAAHQEAKTPRTAADDDGDEWAWESIEEVVARLLGGGEPRHRSASDGRNDAE